MRVKRVPKKKINKNKQRKESLDKHLLLKRINMNNYQHKLREVELKYNKILMKMLQIIKINLNQLNNRKRKVKQVKRNLNLNLLNHLNLLKEKLIQIIEKLNKFVNNLKEHHLDLLIILVL